MHTAPLPVSRPPATAAKALDDEAAYEYASSLLLRPTEVNPPGWRVDWAGGPWPVTVRTRGRRIALGGDRGDPLLRAAGRILFLTFAVTAVRFDPAAGLAATPDNPVPHRKQTPFTMRRPIPSGGSMYPTEAYLLLADRSQVLHYDPYRHELIDLGRPLPAVLNGTTLPDGPPAAVLVLTYRFWKNAYKYGEFACRLGSVDAGVALGRALRLAVAGFGPVAVPADFDDEAINACIGIDGTDETTYAVLTLGPGTDHRPRAAVDAARAAEPAVLERSGRITRLARFDAMQAAMRARPRAAHQAEPRVQEHLERPATVVGLPPPARIDLLDTRAMVRRTSNGDRFTGRPVGAAALAAVLVAAAEAISTLRLASADAYGTDITLGCAVNRVDGVPSGWYRYRPRQHDLVDAGGPAEPARVLQAALFAGTVNIDLAAVTVHVLAERDFRRNGRGPRGYREQQLAVGVAVEAVTLAAHAAGLGSHPLLGFDTAAVDRAYRLPAGGPSAQAQVCVGVARPGAGWEITVVPR